MITAARGHEGGTAEGAVERVPAERVRPPPDDEPDLGRWLAERPFATPAGWGLFSYTGA